jgi:hypothetical protein
MNMTPLTGAPQMPDLPIITPDRLLQAFFHFMSQELTIEEAAQRKDISDTTLRARIELNEIYSRSVYEVAKVTKDGKRQVRTNMRLQWLAEDRAGETHAKLQQQLAEAKKQRRKAA